MAVSKNYETACEELRVPLVASQARRRRRRKCCRLGLFGRADKYPTLRLLLPVPIPVPSPSDQLPNHYWEQETGSADLGTTDLPAHPCAVGRGKAHCFTAGT